MKVRTTRHHWTALLLALATAACGSGGTGGAPATADLSAPKEKAGTLTMVTKFADPQYAPYFEKVVAAYEQANPKVDIKLEQVGDQPYKDKIRVLSASRDLPDIYFSWAGDFANKFVRAGLAADLTGQIGPGTSWGSTFAPAALKAFEYGGRNYGVPLDLDGKYMAYDKAVFAKAGVGVPKTFEELLTACDAFRKAGVQPIAFGNQYGWAALHFVTQLNAYDVPPATLRADYDPATGAFTDPGYVTALKQFSELVGRCGTKDANGLSHETAQAQFIAGKAAMHYVESVEFEVFVKANPPIDWDIFRLPAPAGAAGDPTALTGAPDGFLVNARSRNAGLAVDFLKFLSSKENAATMTKDFSWLSPVKGSATSENAAPQLISALDDMDKAGQFAVWLDTVTHAEVASAYLSGVEGMLSGSRTPEQVMAGVRDAAAKARKEVG
ncbi:ABC transporter substrate-binding protein [Nonomuraea pusilla]|uniref:Raffinose/stachyose/melibiose transport system substrate-binding protein n=1 Tax=Nonomuraea pusilla TaxID=46177 RepID=A0A1H7L2D4_9ACTN|nr:extracellular solute-binding protein [Nonomuraea pusilla]SEK93162.1 raffinose/stachyose/melibiose transport system substrate-binding protein [Nonomuraea pusilla]